MEQTNLPLNKLNNGEITYSDYLAMVKEQLLSEGNNLEDVALVTNQLRFMMEVRLLEVLNPSNQQES